MKKISLFLFFTLLFSICAQTDYTIKKGDTLFSIAANHGMSVEELQKLNNIDDASRIFIGQIIKVVTLDKYEVLPGDTLYGISKKFKTSVDELERINGFTEEKILRIGEFIKVPALPEPIQNEDTDDEDEDKVVPREQTTYDTDILWPVSGTPVSLEGKIKGIEIPVLETTDVVSISSGKVVLVGPYRGYGNVVIIEAQSQYFYAYAGQSEINVEEGDIVDLGTTIGRINNNTKSENVKLIFFVYKNGQAISPETAPRL